MANKSAKAQAARNTSRLNQTLLITLGLNVTFLILRAGLFRGSFTKGTVIKYLILSSPAWAIQFWFERIGRPVHVYAVDGTPELKRAGEDLDAKGLTEYLWDVLYWTWLVTVVAIFGDWAWWLWTVIPLYSGWLAYTTFVGARQGMAGLAGAGSTEASTGGSKRQQKLEKRGGQRVAYR